MSVLRIIADIFLFLGCFFALAGTVGMLRMPDVFCRMQSSTNIATLGMLFLMIGALIYAIAMEHSFSMAVKIVAISVFILLTNPVASHALCRGAYNHGIRPEKDMERDDYGRDKPHD